MDDHWEDTLCDAAILLMIWPLEVMSWSRYGLVRVLGLPLFILWMPGILLVLPVIILAFMIDVVMTLYRGE